MNSFTNYEDMSGEEEMPVAGIRVLSYIDKEGETRYRFRFAGDCSVIEMIGLLEVIQLEIASKTILMGD